MKLIKLASLTLRFIKLIAHYLKKQCGKMRASQHISDKARLLMRCGPQKDGGKS